LETFVSRFLHTTDGNLNSKCEFKADFELITPETDVMENIYKTTLSFIPASFITFLLLVFMTALVYTVAPEIKVEDPPNLTQIYHTDDKVTTVEKTERVEPPQAVEDTPVNPTEDPFTPESSLTSIFTGKMTAGQFIPSVGPAKIDSDYIPVYVQQPRFPSAALRRGVSGYAVVQVTITTSGKVRDPLLLEESPEGYGFGREALKAAGKLKYNPRVVDGVPEEVSGVPYKFSFKIAE
jgi:periplasmic protein TonB